MRNNRNTVGDQFKPSHPRNLVNSVQRKTMTNPQMQYTQSRQLTQQQQNEKMAVTINSTLLRLPNQGNRSSISNSLQPKASTLISTISAFMNSIDRNFQKSNLDIQMIPQLLSFWGYSQNYNKTVFQPVGAQHTWPVCLNMMEFFAEISNYFFQYRMNLDQCQPQTEEIDLILQTFAKNDVSTYEQYLQNKKTSLVKQQQDLTFKIQSSQLTLKNLKKSQKSLSQLQAQQQVLRQKLQRQSQNVIELDQQNNSILHEIQKNDDQTQQLQLIHAGLLSKIKMLQEQISNQQLSVEEAQRMQQDIRQYNIRIRQCQNQSQNKKRQFQKQKNQIVQDFYRVVQDINQIKSFVKNHQGQFQKRKIDIIVPQTDHVSFTQSLHTEDMNVFNQAVSKMFDTDKIKPMILSQQAITDLIQHQYKLSKSQLNQFLNKKNNGEVQNKQVSQQVQKLQKYRTELLKQIQASTNRRNILTQKTLQTKQNITNLNIHKQKLLHTQNELTKQTKQRKQHMLQGIRIFKKQEEDCDNIIKGMEEHHNQTKRKVQEILQRLYKGFNYLNGQLQGLL